MKKVTVLLVILMLAAWEAVAQESAANTRFYEGVLAEEVTGDLDKALSIYQDLLKTNKSDRILSAKCLYHIGLTYEKKGSDKAIGFYSDVLEKYPEQTDLAELARGRITKLKDANTFIDPRDGHKYRWVKIGNQIWMAENLAYMPHVNPAKKQEDGIWVYDYDGEDVAAAKATEAYQKYGCLYDWAMAMNIDTKYLEQPWNGNSEMHQGICPPGWHLPTDGEWKFLEKSLGMTDSLADVLDDIRAGEYPSTLRNTEPKSFVPVGKYLKSSSGWFVESNGDNSSGLSMQPAGVRNCLPKEGYLNYSGNRAFEWLGYSAVFWTSTGTQDTSYRTKDINQTAYSRDLYTRSWDVDRTNYKSRMEGVSVRCVKDDSNLPVLSKNKGAVKYEKIQPSPTIPQKIVNEKAVTPAVINKFPMPAQDEKFWGSYSIILNEERIYAIRNSTPIIYSLDRQTLDTIWTHHPKEANVACMVESKGFILYETANAVVGIRKADGKQVWQIGGTGGALMFSRVADEAFYIHKKGFFCAINVNTGEEIWSHKEDGTAHLRATLVNDTLFVPSIWTSEPGRPIVSRDETKQVVVEAIDAKTGKSIWEYKFYGQYWHCAYNNGVVMIRGYNNVAGPYLIAVNAKTGKKEWATYLGTSGSSETISVGDSTLYMLSANFRTPHQLLALDFNGRFKWNKMVPNIFRDRNEYPVVFNNQVFFITGDARRTIAPNPKLVAVNATDGSVIYTYNLESEPLSYPIFKDNKMYIGCKDGLYVYELPKIE